MDTNIMITTHNTALTEAASEMLGKEHCNNKPWLTGVVLDLCEEMRDLKKNRYAAEMTT